MAIEIDKVVGITYTLTDANTGDKLDSNEDSTPLEFITGKGQIIAGLEEKISTMNEGDKGEVVVEPSKGYGELDPSLQDEVPIEQFAGIELQEGMTLFGNDNNGQTIQVKVVSFNEKTVIIDYNHPMAGKTLKFVFTVVSVRAATEDEVAMGIVGGAAAAGGCCGSGGCGSDSSHSDHSHNHDNGGCGCSH